MSYARRVRVAGNAVGDLGNRLRSRGIILLGLIYLILPEGEISLVFSRVLQSSADRGSRVDCTSALYFEGI